MKSKEEVDKWLQSQIVENEEYRSGFLVEYKSIKAAIIASLPGNNGFAMHHGTSTMFLMGDPVFKFTKTPE